MQPNHRRCVACRKIATKQEFWRLVRTYPDHKITLSQGSGRSAYLCPQESCLKAAQKKNRLGRSLKAIVPDSIYHQLEQCLDRS